MESFLRGGLALVQQEPATTVWFALRLGKSTFGIFDAFPNEAGREAHLAGKVAEAPVVEKLDILAAKLPSFPPTPP